VTGKRPIACAGNPDLDGVMRLWQRDGFDCFGVGTMNKSDLITAVAATSGLSKEHAAKAVEGVFKAITEALAKGEPVRLVGFGNFATAERGERQGKNPRTGAQITLAARKTPKFTAGGSLKDAVNGG